MDDTSFAMDPMNRRTLLLKTMRVAAVLPAAVIARAACAQDEPRPLDAGALFDALRSRARGFDAGTAEGAQVFVVFDPQCPHCARMWANAAPLRDRVRFTWVPVAILGPRGAAQGALMLAAADPAAEMERHESRFALGGLPADASAVDPGAAEAVRVNTALFVEAGGRSVPTIVWRDARGRVASAPGALSTDDLRSLFTRR